MVWSYRRRALIFAVQIFVALSCTNSELFRLSEFTAESQPKLQSIISQLHSSDRSQRSSRVWENLEYLIKPQVLENVTNGSLQSSKQEFPAVMFHSLHRCNQRRQTRAINVSHARKIDHQTLRLVVDHGIQ